MLTAKKKRFCFEWVAFLNATQAAIKAGYSPKGAYQEGHRLLKNAEIQRYIEHIREELGLEPDIAKAEEVLRGYTRDIRFDPGKLFDEDGNRLLDAGSHLGVQPVAADRRDHRRHPPHPHPRPAHNAS